MKFMCLTFVLAFSGLAHSFLLKFKPIYEWKEVEYEFESNEERAISVVNGTFAQSKVSPIDVQPVFLKSLSGKVETKFFVTTPRLSAKGVPATLSVITDKSFDGNPVLRPYPNWALHQNPEKCAENRLVSAARLWYDECGRLWVLDHGYVGPQLVCNPQISVFDVTTDKLLFKHEIDESKHKKTARYDTAVVEVLNRSQSCLDSYAYVTDPVSSSLLVFSLKQNRSYVVRDKSFEPDVKYANFSIAGDNFTLNYGLVSLSLSPASDSERRQLVYHTFAGLSEGYVLTKDLRNATVLENGGSGTVFHTYAGRRSGQSGVEAYDEKGRVYFSLLNDVKLARWNDTTEYAPRNFEIIGDDRKILQFPSSIKVAKDENDREGLYVLTTRYQKFLAGALTPNETNFRILHADISA